MASCNRLRTLICQGNTFLQYPLKGKQCSAIFGMITSKNVYREPSKILKYNEIHTSTSHNNKGKDVTEVKNNELQTETLGHKAKENVKTASYGMVIVVGVGVTCFVLYTVMKELFTGDSPTALFQMASEKCVEHPQVQDLLGEPIKAFGEETRRGRRRHVTSLEYVDENGKKGIRVQFYLQGLRKRGTAQIDAREGEDGHFKTRYIIVTADDLLRTSVVVEDNR